GGTDTATTTGNNGYQSFQSVIHYCDSRSVVTVNLRARAVLNAVVTTAAQHIPLARYCDSVLADHFSIVPGIVDAQRQILESRPKIVALATTAECAAVDRLDTLRGKFFAHCFDVIAHHLEGR